MNEKSSGGGGIGFVGLLTIVFITLKLTHVIGRGGGCCLRSGSASQWSH